MYQTRKDTPFEFSSLHFLNEYVFLAGVISVKWFRSISRKKLALNKKGKSRNDLVWTRNDVSLSDHTGQVCWLACEIVDYM